MKRRFLILFSLLLPLWSCSAFPSSDPQRSESESEHSSVSESLSSSDPYVPYCVQTQEFEGEAYLGSLRFSKLEDGTWEVTCPYPEGYDGASVRIPDEVNGIPVTSVGYQAFYGAPKLEQVQLPHCLKHIKSMAFCDVSLSSVILPDGLQSIGSYAFMSNRANRIRVPASVQSVGHHFPYPAQAEFENGSPFYVEGGIVYGDEGRTLVYYANPDEPRESLEIGPKVETIMPYAFYWMETLRSVTIGPNVKTIKNNAFMHCPSLETVAFPSSLREIGDEAFYDNASLKDIYLNEGLEKIGHYAFVNYATLHVPGSVKDFHPLPLHEYKGAMIGVLDLSATNPFFEIADGFVIRKEDHRLVGRAEPFGEKDIAIPEGVEVIGEQAFMNLTVNGNLSFPSSLKRIEARAFENATIKGTTNGLPEGLTHIGESAFERAACWKDSNLLHRLPSTVEEIGKRAFSNYETMLPTDEESHRLLPESVKTIGDYAFAGTNTPKSVLLPSALQDLGVSAFADCRYLQTFETEPDHPRFSVRDGVVYDKTFSSVIACPAGKTGSLALPNTIKRIGSHVLNGQIGNLESLTIPASVEYIGESAFSINGYLYGSSLTITFEEESRIRYIGEKAFYWVYQAHLPESFLPEGLEFLGPMAFGSNTGPETFRLPASLKYLGSGAFAKFHIPNHGTITIRYAGTRAEWKAMDKGHAFFDDSSVGSLRASDGKILDIPQDDPQSSSSFPMPPGF